MPTPEEYRCAACGGDLREGHNTPCAKCGCLWEDNELDSRKLCPVCDGQLGLRHAENRRSASMPELPRGRSATLLVGSPPEAEGAG